MKKNQIQFHGELCRKANPAINVKVHTFGAPPCVVATHFGCSEKQAENALQFAFDVAAQDFWEQVQELATHYLWGGAKTYSEGRSGGWLTVHGLEPVDSWDGLKVSRWGNFVRAVKRDIAYRSSWEQVRESIEVNEWHKEGSELFNFVNDASGTRCVADLKQEAIAQGFGTIIRN